MEIQTNFELTREFIERFQLALNEKDDVFIRESLEGVNYTDISEILESFTADECKYVFHLLPDQVSADILNDLDEDVRLRFLQHFERYEIAKYVALLDSDDGADMLYEMPIEDREKILSLIDNEERVNHIQDLLRYEEDVAGGLMAKELIKANKNWTVLQTIEEIRKQAHKVEKIYSVYVVDNNDILLGRVALKNIILADDDVQIADIYDKELVTVETYYGEKEVAQIMQKYDLEAVPVVNPRGKLMGRITIDDVIDVITELAEEERQLMTGVSSGVEEDDSVWQISRARLPWLMIGMFGGILGAQFMGLFEQDIILIPAVAFFIPLITATGGNVGIQTSAIVVQTLANSSFIVDTLWRRMGKVLLVAVVNGLILALVVFGSILLINRDQSLAATVSLALFSVVLLASFSGTITPLVLHKLGVNPALASGPFITTTNDLLGLAVYFSVTHLLYNL